MLIKVLLVISIIVQTLATIYALRLVRATKYNSVWILFIVGFSLLTIERLVQLLIDLGVEVMPRWWFAYLGVTVSICLSIGVMYAHKLFTYIDRLNHQRTLLNKRILTAVLRTEEKARSRFSKELHDGLGPLLSSAKMSLTALSRDERNAEQREIIDNTTYVIEEAIRSLREISNNLSPHVLNDFGLARGRAELHRQECCDARREDPLHDQPPHGALRYGCRGDPLPGDLRADQQFAQAFGLPGHQPFAFAERVGAALDYSDDGRGFNPQAMMDCGMGLSNIASRINSLGGTFDIASAKGKGMRAAIRVNTQESVVSEQRRSRRRKK